MSRLETIKQYFTEETLPISINEFLIDIVLTVFTAYIIGKIYEKYGNSLSNRASFAQNFILFALTTMMVITIIKSSIALSLGLVGALSIVRFRSAIKDPEELIYIFLTMGMGLGFGSGNRNLTLVFFVAICIILVVKGKFTRANNNVPMFLSISTEKNIEINKITQILKKHLKKVELNRYEHDKDGLEAIFGVNMDSLDLLNNIDKELSELDKDINISFTENRGLFN